MNQHTHSTTEHIRSAEYPPEVGNLSSVCNILAPEGASYGVITELYAHDEATGAYDVRVAWYAVEKRQQARQENKSNQAARRVLIGDTLDALKKAMEV